MLFWRGLRSALLVVHIIEMKTMIVLVVQSNGTEEAHDVYQEVRIRLTTGTTGTQAVVSRGRAAAYKQTHARILLMSDESRSDGGMKD